MIYPDIYIVSSVIHFLYAVSLLFERKKNTGHYILSLIFVCFSSWAFMRGVGGHTVDLNTVEKFYRFLTIGMIMIPPLMLHFFIHATEIYKKIISPLVYIVLYLPFIAFGISTIIDYRIIVKEFIQTRFGWSMVPDSSSVFFMFTVLLALLYLAVVLFLLLSWRIRAKTNKIKKQSTMMLLGYIPFIAVFIFDAAPKLLGNNNLFVFTPVVFLLWLISVKYAFERYKFLDLSPQVAIDQIINLVNEMVILADKNGRISYYNHAAEPIFDTNSTKPVNIDDILPDIHLRDFIKNDDIPPANVAEYSVQLKGQDEVFTNHILIVKKYYDEFNDLSGFIFIIRQSDKLDAICSRYAITSREKEILTLVASGKSNKEISETLFISLDTVKKHIYHIFEKLKLNNRNQLIFMLNEQSDNQPAGVSN